MKHVLLGLFMMLFVQVFAQDTYRFYALSSDGDEENPVQLFEFNSSTHKLSKIAAYSGVKNGNYFAISPNQKQLVVTSQSKDMKKSGLVVYSIGNDGALFKTGERFYDGRSTFPCYVSFTPDAQALLTANYGSGSINVWNFANEHIGEITQGIQFEGSGPHKRQTAPHAHYIKADERGHVYAVDLGTDRIMNYVFKAGQLLANPKQAYLTMHPAAGPRHVAFYPEGKVVYVLNELESSISACTLDKETGVLSLQNTVKMLPDDFHAASKAAAIRIHPSGKFVYGSNRGFHCIAAYKVDGKGDLKLIERETEQINWPRDFQITPDGKFLISCNMKANNMSVYKIGVDGTLEYTGVKAEISSPLCLTFIN